MNSFVIYSQTDIVVIATNEHMHHPLANLIDYYKLFFQSYYGQAHFVGSEVAAKRHLEIELSKMDRLYLPVIQDISNRHGLYRVSLNAITNNMISAENYLSIFTSKQHYSIDWNYWSIIWNDILKLLLKLYPSINQPYVIELCDEVLTNKAIISHSEAFRLTYNPHYRVMQLSEFDFIQNPSLKDCL